MTVEPQEPSLTGLLNDELARMGFGPEAIAGTAPAATRAQSTEPAPDPIPPVTVDPPVPVPTGSGGLTSEALTAERVLRQRAAQPRRGWRLGLYRMTGGTVNLGPSQREKVLDALTERARTPLQGCHRVAVLSLKGGVGKTTTTAALGATMAHLRGDRVIAVDANPDRGTLAEKVPRETLATVRDLLAAKDSLRRYSDVRAFTSQGPSRLEVLASESDPGVSQAFGEEDYRATIDVLEHFYSLVLTDCGTGLLHSAMQGALRAADQIVLVSSASLDGARSASATLDWLEAHGYGELAEQAVAVIVDVRPGRTDVDVSRLEEHFGSRCRAVLRIPYDAHLNTGSIVDLDALNRGTREAYLRLAAEVGEGFRRTLGKNALN